MSKEIFGRELKAGDYVLVPVFSEIRVSRVLWAKMAEYAYTPTEKRTWLKIRVAYIGYHHGHYDPILRMFPEAKQVVKYATYDDKTVALLSENEVRTYLAPNELAMLQTIKIKQ